MYIILCYAEKPFLLHKKEKRGLAILVTCDYEGTAHRALRATNGDADEMDKTFRQFQYDIHPLKNGGAKEREITTLLEHASYYLSLYSGDTKNADGSRKVIVFAFSGHGTSSGWNDDQILSNDGTKIFLQEQIVLPLAKHPAVAEIPKLFFIDACRGDKKFMTERLKKSDGTLLTKALESRRDCAVTNYRIEYATIPNYTADAGLYESTWMPVLARFLRTKDMSLSSVVDEVNGEVTTQEEDTPQPHSVVALRRMKPPLKLYFRKYDVNLCIRTVSVY